MAESKGGFLHQRFHETLTNVWLTPKELTDQLGPFDLDPCAADPRPYDIAKKNYCEADDGLSQPWKGFVWCNPPYSTETGKWLDRMAEHNNGIGLVFARTDTQAMQRALRSADAVFFIAKRISFLEGTPPHKVGTKNSGAPSVLLAWGDKAVDRLLALKEKRDGIFYYNDGQQLAKVA